MGLVTGSNCTCYIVERVFVDELGLLIGPAVFCCQRLQVTFDRRRQDLSGRTARLATQPVTEEVRERETHGDISSEESTILHLL